jgi:hypothetical protein
MKHRALKKSASVPIFSPRFLPSLLGWLYMIDIQQIVRESLQEGMKPKQIDRMLHDMGWEQEIITEAIEACLAEQRDEGKMHTNI